jgi:hypothetical protein
MTSNGDDPRPGDPISPREAWDAATGEGPARFRKPQNRLGCSTLMLALLIGIGAVSVGLGIF